MPIRGLTDQGAALPNVGYLRKGSEKQANGFGQDLPYFRFTSEDPAAAERFAEVFGDHPDNFKVILAAETRDEAFEAWCEEFAAGGLKHRCDGERVVLQLSKDGKKYERFVPGEGPACPGGCKPNGRLKVILVGGGLRGTVTVLTHSKHDLRTISSTLAFVERINSTVLGIPFVLRRVKRNISTPRDGSASGRVRQDKWLIDLQPDPDWIDEAGALTSAQRRALRHPPQQALPAPEEEDEDEVDDETPGAPPAQLQRSPTPIRAAAKPSRAPAESAPPPADEDALGHFSRDLPAPDADEAAVIALRERWPGLSFEAEMVGLKPPPESALPANAAALERVIESWEGQVARAKAAAGATPGRGARGR